MAYERPASAAPGDAAWQPEPEWQRLPGGPGSSTYGVWRAGDRVVKRIVPPGPHDPPELADPRHFAWWRRPAEVAAAGLVLDTPGVCGPATDVDEDPEGITLGWDFVTDAGNNGLFLARSLGLLAGAGVPDVPWLATGQLRRRLALVERRGGWPTLARTTVADVADFLWQRRGAHLDRLDALPQVLQHGDPTPANLPGRSGERAVAIDWSGLGSGPVGGDVGYLALAAREDFDPLLDAYCAALPAGLGSPEEAETGARVTAVYTALNRAEWALARAAEGSGALAGKYRHPSVAPYLLALQRQFPQIEALLQAPPLR